MLDWLGWLAWYGGFALGWWCWFKAHCRAQRLERERNAALKIRW